MLMSVIRASHFEGWPNTGKCWPNTELKMLPQNMIMMKEEFNEYFASVFTQEEVASTRDAKQFFNGSENDFLKDVLATEEKIGNKLNKLNEKAVGADEMSPRLLKEYQEEICHPLTKIVQKSLEEGVVSDDWKTANVIPIYKKGSRMKAENYRPVSLTSLQDI